MVRRIAVIDDDEAIRDLLTELLVDGGYEQLVFADSAAALPTLNGRCGQYRPFTEPEAALTRG